MVHNTHDMDITTSCLYQERGSALCSFLVTGDSFNLLAINELAEVQILFHKFDDSTHIDGENFGMDTLLVLDFTNDEHKHGFLRTDIITNLLDTEHSLKRYTNKSKLGSFHSGLGLNRTPTVRDEGRLKALNRELILL